MDHISDAGLRQRYADQFPPEDVRALDAHIDECPFCQERANRLLDERWPGRAPIRASEVGAADELEANHIVGRLTDSGQYRHLYWTFPTPEQLASINVPFAEWDSLFSDCRAAVIYMKYFMIAVADGRSDADDKHDYFESVRKCKKRFKLPR